MPSYNDSICGIDIGRECICIAQYNPAERSVENIAIKPLVQQGPRGGTDSLRTEFKKLVQDIKITNLEAVCSLPSECAVIKKILIDPGGGEQQVRDTIEWELSQQIVGSINEYVFDYHRLPERGASQYERYLGVAYRSRTVDELAQMVRANRLSPAVIDLDIFALMNVYELNYPEERALPAVLALAEGKRTKLVLTVDGDFVDFDILEHGEAVHPDESYGRALKLAVSQLLGLHTSLPGHSANVYFAGPLCAQAEFADLMVSSVERSALLSPFVNVTFKTEMAEAEVKKFAPQLAVAVGLAFRGTENG
jgi:Tfp pilus assembly PilM family ATPase